MQLHLTTRRFELPAGLEDDLRRRMEHLAPRLRHFNPDLVHLDVTLEWHPRKREYSGSFRLSAAGALLPARRNRAASAEGLLDAAFDDLEEQLARYTARLRRERHHERKRASTRSQEALEARERALLEERELLDRALREAGRDPLPEVIEHVLADVLAAAHQRLPEKPARWSIPGWLTWLARRQVRRELQGLAVAQSARARR